ncbi:MAG: metallophosphoesterase [Planctomycetota bacterium]
MPHLGFAIFVFVVFCVPDLIWWRWADRRVRDTRWARVVVALFIVTMMSMPLTLVFFRSFALRSHEFFPMAYTSAAMSWHFLLLPATLLIMLASRVRRTPTVESRRGFLVGAVALGPPIATGITVATTMPLLRNLRQRDIDVPVPGLPPALDGMTIAHVSDLHVGKFTRESCLARAVELTNAIEADLVLGTGDLIDLSSRDVPQAIDFLERLDPRSGHFLCEGNHDLIDSPRAFYEQMERCDVPVLRGQERVVEVRGEPVQLVGAPWMGTPQDRPVARDDAFPILLAHHPHDFDDADGFKLVVAGHTHGGQLMLNEQLGFGPLLYKYWSGLYTKPDRSLVVSNGVGHWFPVRTAAPAEVLKLTLRRADSA